MPEFLEKIAKQKLIAWIMATLGGTGCIVFPIIFIVIIIVSSMFVIFSFDFGNFSLFEKNEISVLAETDGRMVEIQEEIFDKYEVEVNGALIGSSLQVAMDHNQTLSRTYVPYSSISVADNASAYVNSFPSTDLLYEMAEGMVVTEKSFECFIQEFNVETNEKELIKVDEGSYIEEYVGVFAGHEVKSCEADQKQVDLQDKYLISENYYTEMYLKDFFADKNITGVEDEITIKIYTDEVIELYNNYIEMIYGSNRPILFGLNYISSVPVIAKDGSSALPVTWDYDNSTYGANITTYFFLESQVESGEVEYDSLHPDGHFGIDLGCNQGNPAIYAMYPGTVETTAYQGSGYGYYVILDHGAGVTTLYAHLFEIDVIVGEVVAAGDIIGLCGTTGFSTGPHLHLEYITNNIHKDPLPKLEEIIKNL